MSAFRVAFDPDHDTLEIYVSESSWARDGKPLLSLTLEDARFLARLGREIVTQDGQDSERGPTHATARPLYVVQRKVDVVLRDGHGSYGDPVTYVVFDEDWNIRHRLGREPRRLPDGWSFLPVREHWEAVGGAAFFTRSDAERYTIDMAALRELLIRIANPTDPKETS